MKIEEWLVSVLITTHNRCQLLERAISSVRNQSYRNLEIIIIDDNSVDGTETLIKSLMRLDSRIKYLKIGALESKGGNYARNSGIRLSSGKVIAFLDDDDEWREDKIELQVEFLMNNRDVKAISTDLEYVYVIDGKEYATYSNLKINRKPYDFFVSSWLNVTSTMMIYRDVMLEIGGFDENIPAMQEIEMSYRVCMNCNVDIIKQPLVKYYQYLSDKQQITNNVNKYLEALDYVSEKYKKEYELLTNLQRDLIEKNNIRNIAHRYLRSNQREMYRDTLGKIKSGLSVKEKIEYLISYFFEYKDIIKLESKLQHLKKYFKRR